MKYYKASCSLPLEDYCSHTDKAICLTMQTGWVHTEPLWIPKSILKYSEPNEYGNGYVYIPVWFVKNTSYRKFERVIEIDIGAWELVDLDK